VTPTTQKREYRRSSSTNRKFDGVRKRCKHPRKEWVICACPWFFAVIHQGKRHAGKIPGATNEAEARSAFKLIVGRVENGLPAIEPQAPAVIDGLTVEQLGVDWLSKPRDRKASVIDGYRDHLRAHINPVIGSRLVSSITPDDCENLVMNLKRRRGAEPLSTTTKQSIAVTVQALFSFAVDKRKRIDNPATKLARVVIDPDESPDNDEVIDRNDHSLYFTDDEAQHVLRTIERTPSVASWYLFVRMAFACGLRMSELVSLRYEHVNWRGGYLIVKEAFVKGRKTIPKNRDKRTVTLSRELRARLRLRWREHRDSTRLIFGNGTTPVDFNNFRNRQWRTILEEAELDYRDLKAMRHTHTSSQLMAGANPVTVSQEAGRSLAVTMRVYAHFLPAPARTDAEGYDARLAGKDPGSLSGPRRTTSGHQPAPRAKLVRLKA
jgi:integrase